MTSPEYLCAALFVVALTACACAIAHFVGRAYDKAAAKALGFNKPHADDVAAASAAHLFNLLPGLMALPDTERHTRLAEHFATCILAYCELLTEFTRPSVN